MVVPTTAEFSGGIEADRTDNAKVSASNMMNDHTCDWLEHVTAARIALDHFWTLTSSKACVKSSADFAQG